MKFARAIASFFRVLHGQRQHAAEEEALIVSTHNQLQRLPDRHVFLSQLALTLDVLERSRTTVAVLYIDIDNFKLINNSLGHTAGDLLLATIAQRIQVCAGEQRLVARIGSDEFAVLIPAVATQTSTSALASLIQRELRQPIEVLGHELYMSASIGIAFSHAEYEGADILLRNAHAAMCEAKRRGYDQQHLFTASTMENALERLMLEGDLRRALARGEFRVHYQPIVALATGEMVEVEALVRWEHPRRGVVMPADFIGVAEETGLILPIGQFILAEACRQVTIWHLEFPQHPIFLSVNLSARQFHHSGLVEDIAEVLEHTGLRPSFLKLEITESALMYDVASTLDTLKQLKALGVQLAVDDFGTGYSSLNYLTRFPVDVLKIDRSFVERLGVERESTAIIEAIITLANALDLDVVGEGLERAEQSRRLSALGCERAQGYYYARPLTTEAIRKLFSGGAFPLVRSA